MAPRSASQAEPYPLSTPESERLSDRVFSPSKPRAVFSFRTRSTFLNTGPQPIPPQPVRQPPPHLKPQRLTGRVAGSEPKALRGPFAPTPVTNPLTTRSRKLQQPQQPAKKSVILTNLLIHTYRLRGLYIYTLILTILPYISV